MGKTGEALIDFNRALELNGRYGPALRGAGMCKFQAGRYAEAIPDLEHAANAEPDNAVNYYLMGIADVALDRREHGRAALQKALSLDPVASVRAHVHLATLLIRVNRPKEAAQEIGTYLEAVPDPPDKQGLLAILTLIFQPDGLGTVTAPIGRWLKGNQFELDLSAGSGAEGIDARP